tara:strand:- start:256 stop:492 length:237 start_codon:yes stop_codon:yes gene_type:complete
MSKYKNLKPEIIESFLDKIFANAAKKAQSDAIKKLSKKDKTFAKNYATLVKLRDKVEKDLKAKGIDIDDEGREILRKL